MEKREKIICLKGSLVIVFMAVIFYMSHKPANESNEISYGVISVLQLFNIDINSYFGNLANFAVRKAAHFSEYFILSLLLYSLFKEKYKIHKNVCLSIVVSFVYACSDELHQYFIPGRAMMFRDVVIDTAGAIVAMGIIWIIKKLNNKKSKT
ncbi:MAG: VanZ family protein [Clostridiaceae bacterium]